MEVRLLGPVDVMADDGSIVAVPGQKLQHLLAALAVERGKVVSTDRLVSVVYGDAPPRQPANSLQVLVSRLRRSLPPAGAAAIETTDAGYRLNGGGAIRTDIERFEALVSAARLLVATDESPDPAGAGAHLRDALDLVRGEPLAGLPDDGWARAEKARLSEAQLAAVEDRIDADLATGGHAEVVPELEALTGEHPLRERLWAQLMLALYRCGRQGESLRAFADARRTLVDELGIEPGPELRRMEAAVLAQDPELGDAPPLPRSARTGGAPTGRDGGGEGDDRAARTVRAHGNVPRPLTACLGRQRELDEILDLVAGHRLVTLVGPGGAGKTRLSLEVAQILAPDTPDGVWLVDLAATRDEAGVLLAVVRALGLDEGVLAGTPIPRSADEVAAAVADRTMVLLVDNCEQVVDHVARLAETLLGRCPDLQVLATSRETLGVPGEFLFVVPPLPLESAVELFIERMAAGGRNGLAAAVRDDEWHRAVADICQRLDGLPLAVELAAARARHLDVVDLAARLDRRFDVLVEGPRTAQPRQRTLRAVVDWSYELLDDDERLVFERLSVFAGGATLDAARAVCAGDDDVDPAAVEGVLGRLVDKSLVTLDGCATGTRFTMLQTLGEYAAERLAEREAAAGARRRHAAWINDLTATVVISTPEAGRSDRVRAVQAEAANLQQAVAWALDADPELALRLAANLGWHWFTTMQSGLAWSVLTTALDTAVDPPDELVARAKALAGLAGTLAGRRHEAEAYSADAQVIEERIGDPQRLGWYYFLQASQRVFSSEPRPAGDWLERADAQFREAGDEHGLSAVDYQRGVVAGMLGDLVEARRLLERARDAFRRLNNHMTLMASLARLGEVAERDGRSDDAFSAWAELREMAVDTRVPALVTLASAGMALVRVDIGDRAGATRLAEEAMASSREGFSPVIGGYALAAWGTAQVAYGDSIRGVERVEEAAGLFSRVGYHGGASECWRRLSRITAARGDARDAVRCAEQAVRCAEEGHDVLAQDQAHAQLDAARNLPR
jgi:predicted ATPase/DNA-binding SARP family transcriptional activator